MFVAENFYAPPWFNKQDTTLFHIFMDYISIGYGVEDEDIPFRITWVCRHADKSNPTRGCVISRDKWKTPDTPTIRLTMDSLSRTVDALAHELWHVLQIHQKKLDITDDGIFWMGERWDDDMFRGMYDFLPWEIETNAATETLSGHLSPKILSEIGNQCIDFKKGWSKKFWFLTKRFWGVYDLGIMNLLVHVRGVTFLSHPDAKGHVGGYSLHLF